MGLCLNLLYMLLAATDIFASNLTYGCFERVIMVYGRLAYRECCLISMMSFSFSSRAHSHYILY